jgi:c-di-GMP-binding flagellar brake protein YcgR
LSDLEYPTERRRYLRVPLRCTAKLTANGTVMAARSVDISLGGMFLFAPWLPTGTSVVVQMDTPEQVRVEGTVLRSEERQGRSGLVLQFTRLSPAATAQLTAYVLRVVAGQTDAQ